METKFHGLTVDDPLSRKLHIEQVVNKMCTACYAVWNIKHTVPLDTTFRLIYFAHTHAIMIYGIIFWGSSYCSNRVFIYSAKEDYQNYGKC